MEFNTAVLKQKKLEHVIKNETLYGFCCDSLK